MADELPPLVQWAKDPLRSEVHRLMNYYRINNGDELYRAMRAYAADSVARDRERLAQLCEWLPMGNGLQGKTFAEAIRGRGLGGKLAEGFDAAMQQRAAAIRAGAQ